VPVGQKLLFSVSEISNVTVPKEFANALVPFLISGEPQFMVCWYALGELLVFPTGLEELGLIFSCQIS
jgi:hypothetical protein